MATKIYSGKESISSDQIFLVEKGKIYNGKYSISSDELKGIYPEGILIVDNTKIFKGQYAYSSEQILTVSKKNIYKGREIDSSKQIGVIDGDRLNDDEFAKIIYLMAKKIIYYNSKIITALSLLNISAVIVMCSLFNII